MHPTSPSLRQGYGRQARLRGARKITPHLWFDTEAKEAAEFYTSLLPKSKVKSVTTLPEVLAGTLQEIEVRREGVTAMKINPYLNFDGTTEEAFSFYKSVFGGEFTMLQRFKEVPPAASAPADAKALAGRQGSGGPQQEGQTMPAEEGERIMHVALPIGDGNTLMGSDISPTMGHKLTMGNNVYVSLHPTSLADAERLFKELSAGGKVEMPLQKMFWGDHFASFTDKFGVGWMINYHEES